MVHSLRTIGQSSRDFDSEIIHYMVEYITEFLEKPHPVFGGLPICPFVRKARLENRILYKVYRFEAPTDLSPDSPLLEMIQEFCQEGRYEVLMVIHPEQQIMTRLAVQQFIDSLNDQISAIGLVAFGGHPDEDFNIQGVHTRKEPFINFTVQSKQLIQDASDSLSKTDYYKNWTPENLKYVGIPRGE